MCSPCPVSLFSTGTIQAGQSNIRWNVVGLPSDSPDWIRQDREFLSAAYGLCGYAFEAPLWPASSLRADASVMGRKRWSVEEKRRIVEPMLVPEASVARVAQTEGRTTLLSLRTVVA
jgi:hypothetical protein